MSLTSIIPLNCRLELISDEVVAHYRFNAAGHVGATMGANGGPLCAPVFGFRALTADSIELFDHQGVFATWTGITVDDEQVRFSCGGEAQVLKIVR